LEPLRGKGLFKKKLGGPKGNWGEPTDRKGGWPPFAQKGDFWGSKRQGGPLYRAFKGVFEKMPPHFKGVPSSFLNLLIKDTFFQKKPPGESLGNNS